MKIEFRKMNSRTYKVFEDNGFIGYVNMLDFGKYEYNPHPEFTFKSKVFNHWDDLNAYFDYNTRVI